MTPRATAETTAEHLHERIRIAHTRLDRLASELAATDQLAGDGRWSLGEVLAHLVTVTNRYNDFAPDRLAGSPRGVDEVNAREIAAFAGRPISDLLAALSHEIERFGESWGPARGLPLDTPIPFHGGSTIDLECGLANLLNELLVHGRDLAVTAGRDWPIDATDAQAAWRLATFVLPYYVRAADEQGLVVRFELDASTPWVIAIEGGTATSRPATADDEADLVLRGPVEPVVLLFFGRIRPDELADLGVVVAGRRPELITTLPERFEEP